MVLPATMELGCLAQGSWWFFGGWYHGDTLLSISGVPLPTAGTPQLLYKGTSKPFAPQNFSLESQQPHRYISVDSAHAVGAEHPSLLFPECCKGASSTMGKVPRTILLSHPYALRAAREILLLLKLVLKPCWSGNDLKFSHKI